MSVIVCRPAAQFCITCYKDHDGDTCPSDNSNVRTLDVSRDGVTVLDASATHPSHHEQEQEKDTQTMKTTTSTVSTASSSTSTAPDGTVISSCPAPGAEDAAVKAVRTAVEKATVELRNELEAVTADRDVAESLARDKARRCRELENRLGQLEFDMLGATGLLLESACIVSELSVENDFQRQALQIADVVCGELAAANEALRAALTAGHRFARLAYSDDTLPRDIRGEAAIAIVEISDAVTGR